MTNLLDKTSMRNNFLKKSFLLFVLAISISSCGSKKPLTEENTSEGSKMLAEQQVMATLWYQRSAEAKQLTKQCYDLAKLRLMHNLNKGGADHGTGIVIVDIDETILDNSPYQARLIKNGENFSMESWTAWVREANADLVSGAKDFLEFARSQNVEVYYISNRNTELHLQETIENLQKYELPNADPEHVLLNDGKTSDKTERRAMASEGKTVLLYVGDQMTDYTEHSEAMLEEKRQQEESLRYTEGQDVVFYESISDMFILLPNPMYGDFERGIYEAQELTDAEKANLRKENLRINSER